MKRGFSFCPLRMVWDTTEQVVVHLGVHGTALVPRRAAKLVCKLFFNLVVLTQLVSGSFFSRKNFDGHQSECTLQQF
jgi:hypothetical protein